ncbi:Potassium voltage-gated channel protein eag (Ether-a-go-go protein) [Durusdinium trenchii]|uniref:Potassium voltage-gated channel protein eag (Ether-a-go-go protein) n=1 Tax=Durusdinium trenchii TaxID=1381693 RepID=A0ABP0HEX1_9DINO
MLETERLRSARLSRAKRTIELSCMAFFLGFCGVISFLAMDENVASDDARPMFLAVINLAGCALNALDTWVDSEQRPRLLLGKVSRKPWLLCSTVPFATLGWVFGFSQVARIGAIVMLARIDHVLGRYWTALISWIHTRFARQPAQVLRLLWLAIVIFITQSTIPSIYYRICDGAPVGSSWIDNDGLRFSNSTRITEDKMGPGALRFARSFFYVWQTILTVGYGNIAPLYVTSRLFGSFLCMLGVFLLALLIANMTSYLVNIDVAPGMHRMNAETLERVMERTRVSTRTASIIRNKLALLWDTSKGLPRSQMMWQLPRSVTARALRRKSAFLEQAALLSYPETDSALPGLPHKQLIDYLFRAHEIHQIGPMQRIVPPWSHRDGAFLALLVYGTASKRPSRSMEDARRAKRLKKSLFSNASRRIMSQFRSKRKSVVAPISTRYRGGNAGLTATNSGMSESILSLDPGGVQVVRMESQNGATASEVVSSEYCSDSMAFDDPMVLEHHESFPRVVASGHIFGSSEFFGASKIPAPKYQTVSACEVIFLSKAEFRRAAALFPDWGMQGTVDRLNDLEGKEVSERNDLPVLSSGQGQPDSNHPDELPSEDLDTRIRLEVARESNSENIHILQSSPTASVGDCLPESRVRSIKRLEQIRQKQSKRALAILDKSKKHMDRRRSNAPAGAVFPHRDGLTGRQQLDKVKGHQLRKTTATWVFAMVNQVLRSTIVQDLAGLTVTLYSSMLVPWRNAKINSTEVDWLVAFATMDLFADATLWLLLMELRTAAGSDRSKFKAGDAANSDQLQQDQMEVTMLHRAMSSSGPRTSISAKDMLNPTSIAMMMLTEKKRKLERERRARLERWKHRAGSALLLLSFVAWVVVLGIRIAAGDTHSSSIPLAWTRIRIGYLFVHTPMLQKYFANVVSRLATLARRLLERASHSHDESSVASQDDCQDAKMNENNSQEVLSGAVDKTDSLYLASNIGILFLVATHWIACFGMVFFSEEVDASNDYIIGLYWSLTTMTTVGFGDLSPTSGKDSLTGSFVALFGVAVYSIMVSLIGTILKDIEVTVHNINHQRVCVTSLMVKWELSTPLQAKIDAFLKFVENRGLVETRRVLGLNRHANWILHNSTAPQLLDDAVLNGSSFADLLEAMPKVMKPGGKQAESEFLDESERQLLLFDVLQPHFRSAPDYLFKRSEAFLRELCGLLQCQIFSPGETLSSPNDPFYCLLLVASGTVEEFSSKAIKLSELGPGSWFNEANALNSDKTMPCSSTFRVANQFPAEIFILDNVVLRQLKCTFPTEAEQMMSGMLASVKFLRSNTVSQNLTMSSSAHGKLSRLVGAASDMESASLRKKRRVLWTTDSSIMESWRVVLFAALGWNMVAIPLRIAFPGVVPSLYLDILFDLVYAVDVYFRMTRFEMRNRDGSIVTDPDLVWKGYPRSWVGVCEILSALPLDLMQFAFADSLGSQELALLRLNKFLRVCRITRLVKYTGRSLKNHAAKSTLTIIKLVLAMLLVAHWSGCVSYALARSNLPLVGSSWADPDHVNLIRLQSTNNGTDVPVVVFTDQYPDWLDQYIVVMYFSLTTMTGVGFGDITPVSRLEIGNMIAALVVGGLLYSVIIAYLEDIVAQSDLTSMLYQRKSDLITAYLKLRKCPGTLRASVKDYITDLWVKQKGIDETEILNYLSPSLRREVILEVFGESTFRSSPVLGPSKVWRLLLDRMEVVNFPVDHVIFEYGQEARALYFLGKGTIHVRSPDLSKLYYTVHEGGTVGQDGFFRFDECYKGTAMCHTVCQATVLELHVLVDVLTRFPQYKDVFLSELDEFVAKSSMLVHTRKNLTNKKLTKMIMDARDDSQNNVWAPTPKAAQRGWLDRRILFPGSATHTKWYGVVFFATLYNALVIPLGIGGFASGAFDDYDALVRQLVPLNVLCDAIFGAHVFVSALLISRIFEGHLLRTSSEIRRAFLADWKVFLVEVIATFPADQLALLAASSLSWYDIYLIRSVRLVWILRIPSWWNIFEHAIDTSSTVNVRSGFRHLAKILFSVLLISHFMACGYLGVIADQADTSTSVGFAYVDALFLMLYTMTTVGYGNIPVATNADRLYMMVVMLFGAFLCDAGITSTLVTIVDVEDASSAILTRNQEAALYSCERAKLGSDIVDEVARYFEFRSRNHGISDVTFFAQLSRMLEFEVRATLMYRAMQRLPEECMPLREFSPGMLRTLVLNIDQQAFVPDDVLFSSGAAISKIIFVMAGSVRVTMDKSSNPVELSNPGLLLTNRKWGDKAKEDIVCSTCVDAWVCDENLYLRLLKLKPQLGGVFDSLEALIKDYKATRYFEKFLTHIGQKERLLFLRAVEAYRSSPKQEATRAKRAKHVFTTFLMPGALQRVEIPSPELEIIESSWPMIEPDVFDKAYDHALRELSGEPLSRFLCSTFYEEMLRDTWERRRTTVARKRATIIHERQT